MDDDGKEAFIQMNDTTKTVVVLAIRGAPNDGFFGLPEGGMIDDALLGQPGGIETPLKDHKDGSAPANQRAGLKTIQEELFHREAQMLTGQLSRATGFEVVAGFYEHGQPALEDALEQAFAKGAQQVILVDPAMCQFVNMPGRDEPQSCYDVEDRGSADPAILQEPKEIGPIVRYLAEEGKHGVVNQEME